MNKTTGNMYGWVTHTWNPIRGSCSHDCVYCSIKKIHKRFNRKQSKIQLIEKELKANLGEGNVIFVGSSTDMWSDSTPENWIPKQWIKLVLEHCNRYPKNTYLFQSKSPHGFIEWLLNGDFPENTILCTTLETNRPTQTVSKAPWPEERAQWMEYIRNKLNGNIQLAVTIEPIMDFDVIPFINMIKSIKPNWVTVGADSKSSGLHEPSYEKVEKLIEELSKFTEIRTKTNLERLWKNTNSPTMSM